MFQSESKGRKKNPRPSVNIVKQEEQKPILSCLWASQTFCSVQDIKGLDEAHPHWEGSLLTQSPPS